MAFHRVDQHVDFASTGGGPPADCWLTLSSGRRDLYRRRRHRHHRCPPCPPLPHLSSPFTPSSNRPLHSCAHLRASLARPCMANRLLPTTAMPHVPRRHKAHVSLGPLLLLLLLPPLPPLPSSPRMPPMSRALSQATFRLARTTVPLNATSAAAAAPPLRRSMLRSLSTAVLQGASCLPSLLLHHLPQYAHADRNQRLFLPNLA